ncbi:two-component system regulatory protein YycI [Ammoniphilus sp. CFH 90114]|uniref:two-component system regulatory protein YycI n=1 Tax=Ammoniphilus sp. CFH 90114 TaxID=2493665 RepID=UPI0013E975E3|nr:two-component system regulatory protein YycI [Ammoniphilus sp. CFH 90114]
MDWRRAKTLLILAFLILDSFLFYQFWTSRSHDLEVGQQNMGTSSSLQDVLKAKNIQLAIEPPTDMPEMHYLNVRYENFEMRLVSKLPNQNSRWEGHVFESRFIRNLPSPLTMMKSEVQKTFSEHILYFEDYKVDSMVQYPEKLVYFQQWEGYPLFGATLELNHNDQKVMGYRQAYFQVVNKGSGKKVISSLTALRTLIENGMIAYGETVHAIELGYFGHTYDAEIQVIAPVWRIVHGTNQVHYINAITGVMEKTPSLQKKE